MYTQCRNLHGSSCNYEHMIVSAVAGRDYNATSAPLEFPAGVANGAMQCVNVTVYNDKILEYDEFFLVELSIVTFGVWEENTVTNITILNDNDACELLAIWGRGRREGEGVARFQSIWVKCHHVTMTFDPEVYCIVARLVGFELN